MDQKMQAAIHEAGHYILSSYFGYKSSIEIKKDEDSGFWIGSMSLLTNSINSMKNIYKKIDNNQVLDNNDFAFLEKQIKILLAGKRAEYIYTRIESIYFGPNVNLSSDSRDLYFYGEIDTKILQNPTPFLKRSEYEIFVDEILSNNYENLINVSKIAYKKEEYNLKV